MKKITKTLLVALPLFAMLGMTVSCGNIASKGDQTINRPDRANDATFAINVTCDEAVTVNVSNTATSGTRVDFTLDYDETEYMVTGVLVNEEHAVKNSDTSYSFLMPSEEVELVVKGNYLDPAHGKHAISNVEAEKGVKLVGLPEFAVAGEELSFKVQFAWDSPYSFTDKVEIYQVDAEGEKGEDVSVSSLAGVHTFTMPEGNIAVKVGTVAKRYNFTRDTATTSNINSIYTSNDNWEHSSYVTDAIVEYGTQFRVTLKDTNTIKATGVKITTNVDEITLEANESKVVEFEMPASDVTLTVFGEINYKSVRIIENEQVLIEVLNKTTDEEGETVYEPVEDLEHFVPDSFVYVRATCIDENYKLDKLDVKNGSSSISASLELGQTNIYSFTMPNSDEVTIGATTKELIFKGYNFVGKYYGANIWQAGNTIKNTDSSYDLTIDATGSFSKNSKTIKSADATSGDGYGVFTDGYDFCYGEQFVLSHYGPYAATHKKENAFNKDYLVAVKTLDENDARTLYSFRFVMPSSKNFIAVEALRDGIPYGCMFFDAVTMQFYDTNLSFELTSGENIIASDAVFNLIVGNTYLGTIDVASGTYTKAE